MGAVERVHTALVGHHQMINFQLTFFFPLLELAAARAFCSFDFCSLGACEKKGEICQGHYQETSSKQSWDYEPMLQGMVVIGALLTILFVSVTFETKRSWEVPLWPLNRACKVHSRRGKWSGKCYFCSSNAPRWHTFQILTYTDLSLELPGK